MRAVRRLDRAPHILRSGLVVDGQYVRVVVRHHDLPFVSGEYHFAVDYEWDLRDLGFDLFDSLFEQLPFGAAHAVAPGRLVARLGKFHNCIVHISTSTIILTQLCCI